MSVNEVSLTQPYCTGLSMQLPFSRRAETVMGHSIAEPRITLGAIWLGLLYVGFPLLLVTGLLDLAMQLVFGVCTGVWCVVR